MKQAKYDYSTCQIGGAHIMSRLEHDILFIISKKSSIGTSRHEGKKIARENYFNQHGGLKGYYNQTEFIHSISTMQNYRDVGRSFAKWAVQHGIKSIHKVTPAHCTQYLQMRQDSCSPFTVSKEMAGLNKIFDFGLNKKDCGLRERKLSDIKRSRLQVKGDSRNYSRFQEQIDFCLGTGLRRHELAKVTANDVHIQNGKALNVFVKQGKGGKSRWVNILPAYREIIGKIILKSESRDKPLFPVLIDKNYDIHAVRSQFAVATYNLLKSKGYSEYECKIKTSRQLGHSRTSILSHYLR